MYWNILWSKWNFISEEKQLVRKALLLWVVLKLTHWNQTDVSKTNSQVCPSGFAYMKKSTMSTVLYIFFNFFINSNILDAVV